MAKVLPQQRLLLELLTMSGEIGVPGDPDGSLFWRTLGECDAAGWVRISEISPSIHKVEITGVGRLVVNQPF